jgi:hypothetical protein
VTRTVLLWRVADQTSDEWAFGQVEIPDNSTGKVSYFESYHITVFIKIGAQTRSLSINNFPL